MGPSPFVSVAVVACALVACRERRPAPSDAAAASLDAASDAAIDAAPDAEPEDAAPPDAEPEAAAPARTCPSGMALVESFCIDRWEAYVVLLDARGREQPHSPYRVVEGPNVRAKTAPRVVPQAYISQREARRACLNAGKRLCKKDEFELACRGPDPSALYPYGGAERQKGACNEGKGSSIPRFFGTEVSKWTYEDFNDPRLNQWLGGLARTGDYARCVSPYGVFDLVGNLHEWGDDEPDEKGHGRFRGGFYGDAEVNGHGCAYVTKAHEPTYHDYSTGFRCCADARE